MPKTIFDKCEEFVNTYGDEIIQDIIEMEMNPDEVCASLGMCTASKWNTKVNFKFISTKLNYVL